MDLFNWNETPAAPVQGPPEPDHVTLKERGSLRLLKYKQGWGEPGWVVEDIHTGQEQTLAHLAAWFDFPNGQRLNGSQLQTVKAWCAELGKEGWIWTEQDHDELEALVTKGWN